MTASDLAADEGDDEWGNDCPCFYFLPSNNYLIPLPSAASLSLSHFAVCPSSSVALLPSSSSLFPPSRTFRLYSPPIHLFTFSMHRPSVEDRGISFRLPNTPSSPLLPSIARGQCRTRAHGREGEREREREREREALPPLGRFPPMHPPLRCSGREEKDHGGEGIGGDFSEYLFPLLFICKDYFMSCTLTLFLSLARLAKPSNPLLKRGGRERERERRSWEGELLEQNRAEAAAGRRTFPPPVGGRGKEMEERACGRGGNASLFSGGS